MHMYRILVVEDDQAIVQAVSSELTAWGMEAHTAENFQDVLGEVAGLNPHLVLLDIGLPFRNGYHWCQEIRRASKVPIIFLSSAADSMNMVMAMNMGADDFIAKPFDLNVLLAKVQALLRRTYDFADSVPVLEYQGALLNTGDGTLNVHGENIPLSKNEYRILLTLMQNKGKVVSREKLMETLWATDSFVDENTLSVNVNRLRRRLDAAGLKDMITTQHGVGYIIR